MRRKSNLSFLVSALLLFAVGSVACRTPGLKSEASDPRVDSAHSRIFDGQIANGYLLVPQKAERKTYEARVRSQLAYSLGQLNGLRGSADVNSLSIRIKSARRDKGNPGYKLLEYETTLAISLPKEDSPTENLALVLPATVDSFDESSREIFRYYDEGFFEAFQERCKLPGSEPSADLFWHDFFPRPEDCILSRYAFIGEPGSRIATVAHVKIAQIVLELIPSRRASVGKKPEYAQIWKDGVLRIVAVYLKDDPYAVDIPVDLPPEMELEEELDVGIAAYNNAFGQLQHVLGKPQKTNAPIGDGYPGAQHPYLKMTFASSRGPVEVSMFLLGKVRPEQIPEKIEDPDDSDHRIKGPYETFKSEFPKVVPNADFIIYGGHSGYGKNLEAIAALIVPAKRQWQLFWLDGCDTYTYASNTLRNRFRSVNPKAGPGKYLDIMANAMPAPFDTSHESLSLITKSFLEQSATYQDIMSVIDAEQKVLVYGEEDNGQPFP